MDIVRGERVWTRFTHIFYVCADCGTMQGPRKYGYSPQGDTEPDSPICYRFAFCDIACHNAFWSMRDPSRMIK